MSRGERSEPILYTEYLYDEVIFHMVDEKTEEIM